MTFIMRSCSDTCSVYDQAECEVEVDRDNMTIEVDAQVSYESRDGADELTTCSLRCGPQVFAHCVVPSLTSGTYQVVAKTFRAEIEVR